MTKFKTAFAELAILLLLSLGVAQAAPLTPEVAEKSVAPYSYAGKLFFVGDDNKLKEICSGQYAGANDVVLTAAHCMVDRVGNKLPEERFVFLHGFDSNTPVEAGKVSQLVACIGLPNAFKLHKSNHDYAFLKMKAASNHGHFALGTGMKNGDAVTSIGYPSNFKAGKELMAVHGSRTRYSDLIIKDVQIFKGNPFGEGASGGAWINPAKEVIGLNAKIIGTPNGPGSDDNQFLSPIFDDTFERLFEFAKAGCTGTNP